jgi:hypothetical protein
MNVGRTVFSQLIEYLPSKEFQKCVERYGGNSRFRGFSCWDQLLAMSFAQLTYRESLRDIEAWRAPPWATPTRRTTGGSMPTSPKF